MASQSGRSIEPLHWGALALLVLCAGSLFATGADRWAEVVVEYLNNYRGRLTLRSLVGNNGYVATLPILGAVAYHRLSTLFPLDYGHLFRGIGLLFLGGNLWTTHRVLRVWLTPADATVVLVLVSVQFIHPSTSSLINVANAGFLPVGFGLLGILIGGEQRDPAARPFPSSSGVLFAAACLSKASFIPLAAAPALFFFARRRVLALVTGVIAAGQMWLLRTRGGGAGVRLSDLHPGRVLVDLTQLTGANLLATVYPPGSPPDATTVRVLVIIGTALWIIPVGIAIVRTRRERAWLIRWALVGTLLGATILPELLTWMGSFAFMSFKLQYLTVSVPFVLFAWVLAVRRVAPPSFPRFGWRVGALACAFASVWAHHLAAQSSSVTSTLALEGTAGCYLNPPLSAWSRSISWDVTFSMWQAGSCSHAVRYGRFDGDRFGAPGDEGKVDTLLAAPGDNVVLLLVELGSGSPASRPLCLDLGDGCPGVGSSLIAMTARSQEGARYGQMRMAKGAFLRWRAGGYRAVDGADGRVLASDILNFIVLVPEPARQLSRGLKRVEVERLLGQPDYSPTNGQHYYASRREGQPGLVVDYRNRNGQVTDVLQTFDLTVLGE